MFSLKLPARIPDKATVWYPTTIHRGKVKCPDRNLSWYRLHHKSHMDRPGTEPWLCTDTTATTCWSHSTASYALV